MHQPKEEIKTNPPNCGSGVKPPAFYIDGREVMRIAGVTPCKESITIELRPCYVNGYKALFHKWINKKNITLALVELNGGSIREVQPTNIRFADTAEIFKQLFDEESRLIEFIDDLVKETEAKT